MFFIIGISSGVKQLTFLQTIVCPKCDHFGRLTIFMTYTYFSFFFIPLFKWGKKYYAKTSCCNAVYSIAPELGKSIEKGETITLSQEDLHFAETEAHFGRECPLCGYPVSDSFEYCPKCGRKL